MSKNITIRDVAKAAGVSITTTSQVLKGVGRYSNATIKRVWDVVNELNYIPNQYAKKFFSGEQPEHEATGLLMRIVYSPHNNEGMFSAPNQYYEPMRMSYFERACMEHDYSGVNYFYRHQHGFRSRLLLNDLIDGAVLATPDINLIENLKKRLPVVLTDINVEPEDVGLPVINPDLTKAFTQTLSLIRQAGITGNLAVFCGQSNDPYQMDTISTSNVQLACIEKAAKKCGVNIEEKHIFNVPVMPETNDAAMIQIADKIFHLVKEEGVRIVGVCYCDFRSLQQFLKARGLRLPEDVVIFGITFDEPAEQGVAAIHCDWGKIMSTAVDVLLQTIEDPTRVCGKYLVPCFDVTDSFLRGESKK